MGDRGEEHVTSATLVIQDTLCSPRARSPLPVRARILLISRTLPLAINLSSTPVLPLTQTPQIPDPFLDSKILFRRSQTPPPSPDSSFDLTPCTCPPHYPSTCFILRLRPSFGRPFSDVRSLTGLPTLLRLLFQAQSRLVPLT